jgi:lipoprotein-anchoring transpeptidase ErfK/SrfK
MKNKVLQIAAALIAALGLMAAAAPQTAKAADGLTGFFEDLSRAFGGNSGPEGRHTTRIMASHPAGTIIVSFGDRRLYYLLGKGQAISYPIAIPKPEARWAGVSYVASKTVNPVWTPTEEMRRENPKLPAFMPGGHPRNPLGVRALYVGTTMYRIHGTDAPWLIGEEVSHGCVRLLNEDIIDLYDRAKVGSKIIITWDRFETI